MTNTIPNVPREMLDSLLMVIESNGYAADEVEVVDELRALLSDPSPAGVDGLEWLLRACHSALYPLDNKMLEAKIDAALSAGKEVE